MSIKALELKGKFFGLFVSFVLLILISPYALDNYIGLIIITLLTLITLITGLYSIRDNHMVLTIAAVLAVITILAIICYAIYPTQIFVVLESVFSVLFYLYINYIIAKAILAHKHITQDTIFGALCVYMLIGIIYANIYQLIQIYYPGSFLIDSHVSQTNASSYDLIYFSFTTLSTVGFGDITPATIQARSIVILEEITGVLYLAVFVSRLVAGFKAKD